jgi:hypothetical protein
MRNLIIVVLTGLMVYFAMMADASAYPKCGLYEPYRCIPAYGNKVICGCGY